MGEIDDNDLNLANRMAAGVLNNPEDPDRPLSAKRLRERNRTARPQEPAVARGIGRGKPAEPSGYAGKPAAMAARAPGGTREERLGQVRRV